MLISNNVLGTKGFLINFATSSAHIESCNVDVDISAKHLPRLLIRKVLANTTTIVSPKSETLVPFKQIPLPDSQNFFFHPASQPEFTLYAHLVDHTTCKVLARNNANHYI